MAFIIFGQSSALHFLNLGKFQWNPLNQTASGESAWLPWEGRVNRSKSSGWKKEKERNISLKITGHHGEGYPLFLWRKGRTRGGILRQNIWYKFQHWVLQYWAVQGGSSPGDVLDLLGLHGPVAPVRVRIHVCHPEQLWQSAGMAMLGPFSFGEWEKEPPKLQPDSQTAVCSFGIVLWHRLWRDSGGSPWPLDNECCQGSTQRVKSGGKKATKKSTFLLITSIKPGRRSKAASWGNLSVGYLSALARTVAGCRMRVSAVQFPHSRFPCQAGTATATPEVPRVRPLRGSKCPDLQEMCEGGV